MATARDRILDAARALVLEQGFGSTSLEQVLEQADASKGALFHHFSSKADLGRALLERYAADDADLLERLLAAAAAETADPAAQVVAFVRLLEEGATAALEQQPSCLFVSFIYERGLAGADGAGTVRAAILHWRERLLELLERAAGTRDLSGVDLPSLADHVFTVIEGAFLLTRALDDPQAMSRQLRHLRGYLEHLLAPAPAAAEPAVGG